MKRKSCSLFLIILTFIFLIGCSSDSEPKDINKTEENAPVKEIEEEPEEPLEELEVKEVEVEEPIEESAEVKEYQYDGNFMIVTADDLEMLVGKDDFTDVCVQGTITEIGKTNDVRIEDSAGGVWTIALGTDRDISSYIGTICTSYGYTTGGISSQFGTPLINVDRTDNCVVFSDGREFYPEIYDSWSAFERKDFGNTATDKNNLVWIPTGGGTKYHSSST